MASLDIYSYCSLTKQLDMVNEPRIEAYLPSQGLAGTARSVARPCAAGDWRRLASWLPVRISGILGNHPQMALIQVILIDPDQCQLELLK